MPVLPRAPACVRGQPCKATRTVLDLAVARCAKQRVSAAAERAFEVRPAVLDSQPTEVTMPSNLLAISGRPGSH
jgi:hypothetical protein